MAVRVATVGKRFCLFFEAELTRDSGRSGESQLGAVSGSNPADPKNKIRRGRLATTDLWSLCRELIRSRIHSGCRDSLGGEKRKLARFSRKASRWIMHQFAPP